jgi:hypothetical protein
MITVVAATVTTTLGSTTCTAASSSFTTASVGQWLAFSTAGAYAAGTNLYQIASYSSATVVVLATPIVAADVVTAGTATIQQFTNLAMHEYAVALALRPIATPDEARNVVDVSYLDLMGIPLRVMVSYVHIYQALFVTVDFGYALGVIRPDFGVIINC